MSKSVGRPAQVLCGLGTVAWVAVATVVGFLVFETEHCLMDSDTGVPLSRGAELVCGGGYPFVPLFLAFVATAFASLAALILAWDPVRGTRRLCLGVALLPIATYGLLRVIVAVG